MVCFVLISMRLKLFPTVHGVFPEAFFVLIVMRMPCGRNYFPLCMGAFLRINPMWTITVSHCALRFNYEADGTISHCAWKFSCFNYEADGTISHCAWKFSSF